MLDLTDAGTLVLMQAVAPFETRRDLALAGAVEVADGALSFGNQWQPLRSGCIYGKLSAIRGHQGHQLQHHDVKASGDCHDDVLIETDGGTVSESATVRSVSAARSEAGLMSGKKT